MSTGPSRRRFQFSLRTILLLGVPWAAALAWIISLDGPYFDPRRVLTHKLGLLILLVEAAAVVVVFRGWLGMSRRFVAGWLVVFAILAGLVLRNRQQSFERRRELNTPPVPASSTLPLGG